MSVPRRLLSLVPGLLRHPLSTGRTAWKRLFPIEAVTKDPDAYQSVANWTFGAAPREALSELFPGIEELEVNLRRAFDRDPSASLTGLEILTLAAIVRHVEPRRILEVGTYDGNTTLNLAANAPPGASVTTIDLPPDWAGGLALDVPERMTNVTPRGTVGRQFGDTDLAERIRQVHGDTASLDWSELDGPFDLVFIDGCHHSAYVENDTTNALRRIATSGLIVWHDYGIVRDVSRVVDRVASEFRVAAIQGTSLAVGFPDRPLR